MVNIQASIHLNIEILRISAIEIFERVLLHLQTKFIERPDFKENL